MSHLSNVPSQRTYIQLEARKSFSLLLWIKDFLGQHLDITGVELRFVMRKTTPTTDFGDTGNLLTNDTAVIVNAGMGAARFDLQASELDHAPGEYDFAIVMLSSGYSSVIVEGTVEINANVEFSSMSDTYALVNPPTQLSVHLNEANAISVYAGQALAPGTVSFTVQDKENLQNLISKGWDALANKPTFGSAAFVAVEDLGMPPGGAPGAVLTKSSSASYHTHWAQMAVGGTGLTAIGIPAGYAPLATGFDDWDWGEILAGVTTVAGRDGDITLNADDVANTAAKFWMTLALKTALEDIIANGYASTVLINKPTLGTAASRNDAYFHKAGDVVPNADLPKLTGLRGFSRGTAAPAGGADGDVYHQYTP